MKIVRYFEAAPISNFQLFVQNVVEIYMGRKTNLLQASKPPHSYA